MIAGGNAAERAAVRALLAWFRIAHSLPSGVHHTTFSAAVDYLAVPEPGHLFELNAAGLELTENHPLVLADAALRSDGFAFTGTTDRLRRARYDRGELRVYLLPRRDYAIVDVPDVNARTGRTVRVVRLSELRTWLAAPVLP